MDSAPMVEVKNEENPSKSGVRKGNSNNDNNIKENIKESPSLNETDNKTKKIVKVQEKNINGNYGRIYIQESSSNIAGDKFDSITNKVKNNPGQEREVKKRIIGDNNNKADNYKRKRVISMDNKHERRNEEERRNDKKCNLRRKSIDRGGDYNNIQVTHLIYSSRDINFHIIDPLINYTDEMRKKYMNKVDSRYRNGRDGKVKVTYNSSCDKIRIKQNDKPELKGKTTVISHRQNISTENNIKDYRHIKKERKEGKEGKDSIIKMSLRNKNDNTAIKGNIGAGGGGSSYKKRNQKNYNINIKK